MITTTQTFLLLLVVFAAGCRPDVRHDGPYRPQSVQSRDSLEAQRLTQIAADLVESDPTEAERVLRQALDHDLHHGPAHNNLGIIYLSQGRLYDAAGEFEWARKLMPGHPDPRVNLGLTLERAGRMGEAIDAYEAAIESRPAHLPAIQALARCQLRHNRVDSQTPALLGDIALRGDPGWQMWARKQLARMAE